MKTVFGIILLAMTMNVFSQEYHLPFAGRWFVMQGGDTLNVNQHLRVRAQWYAIDFMKVGGPNQRALSKSDGSAVKDYYSWSESVLSPVDGEVKEIADQFPDNPLGVKDAENPLGNHVVIEIATNRFVFIAHLQKKSVKVKPGQHVVIGQELGKCGNSGNSDAPHIHMHVQDTSTFNEGQGQNMIFKGINVELTGKTFENVDWPLIRGLFVWNKSN
jgi:hypothetical protein